MNRKQRRLNQAQARGEKKILSGGAFYSVDDAFALAVQQEARVNNRYHPETVDIYRQILTLHPDHFGALNNLGSLEYRFNDVEESLLLLRRAVARHPHDPASYHNLGNALVRKGDIEDARAAYRQALALRPELPRTLYALSQINKYNSVENEDAQRIKQLLATTSIDHDRLYFAMAKIYDDCGCYDESFECYMKGNTLCNAMVSYYPDRVAENIGRIINVFKKEFLAQPFPFASDDPSPVFIIGMPRSGTTLLENALSNHPSVGAAGELFAMKECAEMIIAYPESVRGLDADTAARMIAHYQKRLWRGISAEASRVIDKYLLNALYLGLIALLFPKARIIHCRRNPLDTCLSNYFQFFDLDNAYSFDLRNIAHFHGQYNRLMAHWREALPMPILEISYEETVTDTEATVRKALAFIGLEWNEQCLAPHTNDRAVKTASMLQVRQPVYTQSLERWRRYEKHLGPLKEALALNGFTIDADNSF